MASHLRKTPWKAPEDRPRALPRIIQSVGLTTALSYMYMELMVSPSRSSHVISGTPSFDSLDDHHGVLFVRIRCNEDVDSVAANSQKCHLVLPVNGSNCGGGEVNEPLQRVSVAMRLSRAPTKACKTKQFPPLGLHDEVSQHPFVMSNAIQCVLHILKVGLTLRHRGVGLVHRAL
ncbi:dynein-associated protein, putative [Leishmania tarentolae]|uniref:Dynein-associated protein, putative n=1 Tax=Leishmania tarentolae TaxID=5689 RepID=A0A640KQM1_LEITA|nr:dynein-associated protein, putative [Leishmania tarentolae]